MTIITCQQPDNMCSVDAPCEEHAAHAAEWKRKHAAEQREVTRKIARTYGDASAERTDSNADDDLPF
jgi:hypothetical protein